MLVSLSSRRKRFLFGIGLVSLIPFQSLKAASLTWSAGGGADLLWSTPANWNPAGPPTSADLAIFGDAGIVGDNATINNSIGASITVQGLTYKNNSLYHNTSLASGAALTINSTNTGVVFGIGSESSPAAVQSEFATISGGGSISITATNGDFVVRQGSSASSGSSKATLDLSGINSLTADVAHLWVGVANPPGYVSANRNTGTLYLAKTNNITARTSATTAPGIDVGKSTSNNGGGSFLYLGLENTINADMLGFARVKENGVSMLFNPNFTATAEAHAKFRGANGTGRVVNWTIGDGVTDSATTSVRGTNDFTGGSVDALVDTMVIARTSSGGTGNVVHKGMLTFEKGTIDVNTLRIAVQATTAEGSGRSGDGTVNVYGSANLVVNNALEMGVVGNALSAGAAATVANLNVIAGTVSTPGITTFAASTAKVTVTNGKLILKGDTAVAGTVDAPIDELNLSGATIEMTGGNARIVAGVLNPAEPSTIKITGLPVISSYPVTLKLIQASSVGGALNFTLAPLPAGYVGTLVNNDAGASVDLQLTSGPLPAIVTWNGNISADWDFTTQNWLKGTTASVYTDGDAVILNDSANGSTSINLTTQIKPGEITVNNNTKTYAVVGTGGIGGTASLVKNGSGTLVIANTGTNDFVGTVTINSGTVQVGNGGVEGSLPSGAIVNNASLVYKLSGNVTVTDAITGTGSVSQEGSGTLTLAGANAFTGGTIANSGRLVVNGTLPGTTGLTIGANATLSGSATLTAPTLVSGTIDPGNGTATATLTTGPLTLNAGAKLKFDLSADPAAGNDQLVVNGALVANNNEITINFLGVPTLGVPYTLVTYTGSKVGNFSATVKGTHYTATLDQSVNGSVTVTLSGTPADLKWNSTTSATLDTTSLNWLRAGVGADAFFSGDAMLFDDSVAGVQTALTIPAGVWLVPSSVTVNGGLDYSITGAGKFTGSGSITKTGSGTLTLGGTANDYTGVVTVNSGTLKAASTTALGAGGTANGNTVISSGATLDLAGFQLNGESITVSGEGVGQAGAIVNSGAQQINGVGRVTLAGNTTFGGTGRWDVRGGGATLSTEGNAYNITKVGTNQISLVAANVDAALGDVDIKEGVFAIQTTTIQNSQGLFGDPNKTITIRSGATLNTYNLGAANPLNKKIAVEAGGTIWNENSVSVVSGEVTLLGSATINAGGTSLQFDAPITGGVGFGGAGITKIGSGQLILNANNTYTGQTTVSAGALVLTDLGSIASPVIEVRSGGSVNVSQRSDQTLTVKGGQTLSGNGTITGNVVASPSSFVSPGLPASNGTLTVSGDVALQGTLIIGIDANAHTNDVIKAGSITLGGTLSVGVTGTLQAGDTFKIVDAASIQGGFTAIVPQTPGVGQTWDTANLLVDGTLKVVGNVVANAKITSVSAVGADVQLNGNGGTAGVSYQVLASSDVTAAIGNWTVVGNGTFGANGEFNATIAKDGDTQRFYVIKIGN